MDNQIIKQNETAVEKWLVIAKKNGTKPNMLLINTNKNIYKKKENKIFVRFFI